VTDRRGSAFPIRQLLECALGRVKVIDAATFFEREVCQIRLGLPQPSYLILGGGFDQGFLRASSKRMLDLAASTLIGSRPTRRWPALSRAIPACSSCAAISNGRRRRRPA
jgi:hypothetical protein